MATSSGLPRGGRGAARPALGYFYSTKNIAGCGAAVLGLAATFALGFPGLWPVIVAGAYGAGALAAPADRQRVDLATIGLNAGDLRKSLDRTLRAIHGRVPEDVEAGALQIHDGVIALLGHVATLGPGSQEGFILQKMATDYLPTALQAYLSLPRNYANFHQIANGKTARQVLVDQLTLLGTQLAEVTDAVLKGDTDRLLANGRFLEGRFGGDASLSIGDAPGATGAADHRSS